MHVCVCNVLDNSTNNTVICLWGTLKFSTCLYLPSLIWFLQWVKELGNQLELYSTTDKNAATQTGEIIGQDHTARRTQESEFQICSFQISLPPHNFLNLLK